jgi:sugar/nucleoside kinase (ribokinase family)
MALAALACGDRDNFAAAIASDIRQGMDFIADAKYHQAVSRFRLLTHGTVCSRPWQM